MAQEGATRWCGEGLLRESGKHTSIYRGVPSGGDGGVKQIGLHSGRVAPHAPPTSGSSGYSRFTFVESTISNSVKVPTARFLGSEGLFCFIRICKFDSFNNCCFAIMCFCELYFRFRRFILLVQTKKWFMWNEKGLTWYFMRDIYIIFNLTPLTKIFSISRNTDFKDILPWNISQMIIKTVTISTRIVICYGIKWVVLLWVWQKFNGNWDNNMIRTWL